MNDGTFTEGYVLGRDSNGNDGMWGNGGWWIILLLLFGWGNGGFGFGGGNNNMGYDLGKLATTADVASGFNNSAVLGSLNDLKLGQAGLQQTMCQGFNGINSSIANLGFDLQSCCCQTQRAIDGVNYNMATNTCAITTAINNSTRDIIEANRASIDSFKEMYINDKMAALQAQNAALTSQLSQNSQTNTIINALRPVAQPAYITCSPFQSAYGFGNNGYGCNNGCGCNNSCGGCF